METGTCDYGMDQEDGRWKFEGVATRSKSGVTFLLQIVDARLVFIDVDIDLK
jgi:hypothetical protein